MSGLTLKASCYKPFSNGVEAHFPADKKKKKNRIQTFWNMHHEGNFVKFIVDGGSLMNIHEKLPRLTIPDSKAPFFFPAMVLGLWKR